MKRPTTVLSLVALTAFVFMAGLFDHHQRSLVDWHSVRAVAIQSDDWGLCGFVPDDAALEGLDRTALGGTHFPPVYWRSTLEDSTDVADMTTLLLRHRGRDGLPAVFQPNMIMGFRDLDSDGHWTTGRIREGWAQGYRRPGLWVAVREAIAAGVWAPELHGFLHYDPADRDASILEGAPGVVEAARRGVLVFPGAHASFELGPVLPTTDIAPLWRSMAADQLAMFGRAPVSVVAPDYVWDDRHERMWADAGLRCVQAKRSQRRKDLGGHELWRRIRKYAERQWALWTVTDLTFLERNCRLETAQAVDAAQEARACGDQVLQAWRGGRPAIVEAHRVNYIQTDDQAELLGRGYLDQLLTELDGQSPLYAADAELAAWTRRGVSVDRRGGSWIVRNPGPAARLAVLPTPSPATILVPPHSALRIDISTRKMIERITLH